MMLSRTFVFLGALALGVVGATTDDRTAECGTIRCIPGLMKCAKNEQGQDICVYAGGYLEGHPESTADVTGSPAVTTGGPYSNSSTATLPFTTGTIPTPPTKVATSTTTTHVASSSAASSSADHSHAASSTTTAKPSPSSAAAVVDVLDPHVVGGAVGLGLAAALGIF